MEIYKQKDPFPKTNRDTDSDKEVTIMKKTVSALLALILLLLCGCQTQPPASSTTPTEAEPKPADSYHFSGESRFTYYNGKIYFISGYDMYTSNLPIHAYDLTTGTLISNTSAVKPHSSSGFSDNFA